jgi:RNA polymerase sigma factor (sigma-70 family)
MMTNETMATVDSISDADLVSRTLAGDRNAFNLIVSRYQILICSLAYSRVGHLGQSEDVAQETFITAWKHLRLLRDPAKLRAWLCGIVRNRSKKLLQREGRQPLHDAEALETAADSPACEPLPSDQTIGREEAAILWRSLERIPALYRDPLILYYREHQSIEHVAAALDLSADAAKQRLSRGRKLLQKEVQTFVENALRRTAPSREFSNAVLAALPMATAPVAAAGAGAAAKSTAAAKSGILLACLAPFIGIIAGFTAQWLMFSPAGTRARRAARLRLVLTWIFVLGFSIGGQQFVRYLGHQFGWTDTTNFVAVACFWWFYAVFMATWITTIYRKVKAKSPSDGGSGLPAPPMKPGLCAGTVVGTHLMMFWGVITMAWQTHDRMASAIIAGLMAGLAIWNYFKVRSLTGTAAFLGYIGQLVTCSAVALAIFNLRFDVWLAPSYGVSSTELHQLMPTWIVPLVSVVLVLWTVVFLSITKPKQVQPA